MSLSDSLVYAPKPSAVSSTKARWNQPAYNKSSFNPGEVIMINIPTGRRGSFLNTRMSYLKFRVTNTGADKAHTISADFNIASIFSIMELYHGSNLLEQVHEISLLVNLWHDMTGKIRAGHAGRRREDELLAYHGRCDGVYKEFGCSSVVEETDLQSPPLPAEYHMPSAELQRDAAPDRENDQPPRLLQTTKPQRIVSHMGGVYFSRQEERRSPAALRV
jgi:hypothetical protein